MKIAIAADHAGFPLKAKVIDAVRAHGHETLDLGTSSTDPVDYPDVAQRLGEAIQRGEAERGVLLCGTGLGMSYVANRYPGVRAAVVWSPEIAELSRKHNDANVLVLPARFVSDGDSVAILKTFLETAFDGGRHVNRVDKIDRRNGPEAR
jgi:ribose 5-phosphate isomerase B